MGKNNFMTLMSQIFLAIILCAMTAGCSAVKDRPIQASPMQDSPMQTAEAVSEETQPNNMRQENPQQESDTQPEGKIKVSNMILGEDGEWDFVDYPLKEYEGKETVLSKCGLASSYRKRTCSTTASEITCVFSFRSRSGCWRY